jgi:hypothetical protein
MKKQKDLTIVVPKRATTNTENDLVTLTKCLVTKGLGDGTGTNGALGGEYGYGVDFENDVFMMHHYCWCMKSDCPWCLDCFCKVEEINEEYETVQECDNCKNPKESLPNFWYKPTDVKIHWYKWIGRSMEYNKKPQQKTWNKIFTHCVASLEGEPYESQSKSSKVPNKK